MRRWLGSGWRYIYTLGDSEGELVIRPIGQEISAKLYYYESDAGQFALTDPEPLLGLLADCPMLTATQDSENWYWPFFNQQLSSDIVDLFGHITPANAGEFADALLVRLDITLGTRHAWGQLLLPSVMLHQWTHNSGWQRIRQALPTSLPLTLPIVVGRLSLSVESLQTLRRDDVLMPTHALFTPEGTGVVYCAHGRFHGRLALATQPTEITLFYITQKEEPIMSEPHDALLPAEEQEATDTSFADVFEDDAGPEQEDTCSNLLALPLELTLRCGNLQLTLGELQELDSGSTVMVNHVTPGDAVLCHGNFVLAKGELINVNGSLGFQIIHMLNRHSAEWDSVL